MNKFSTLHALLFMLLLVFTGCKKEIIPPPGSTEPVFTAEGTFGGQNIVLKAGDDNVLMQTEIEKINGVNFFKGILGNSQTQLEMGIFAGNIDIPGYPLPDFSNTSELSFAAVSSQPLMSISKYSFTNSGMISSIQWEVDGEMQSQLNNLKIYEPGLYNVCAHVTFTDNSTASLCEEIIVGYNCNANFDLNFFLGQDHSFKSWIKTLQGTVQKTQWYLNDSLYGEMDEINTDLNSGSHTIRAVTSFTNGVKKTKSILIDGSLYGNNIDNLLKSATFSAGLQDYTVKVKMKRDGMVYTSENTSNASNKVAVDNIAYHGTNAAGDPVYIIHGTINANLKSANGNILPLKMKVSFGVAAK